MKIITTTCVLPACYPQERALERLAAAGFDGLDLAIDYCTQEKDYPFMTDKWEDWAKSLREQAEKLGISYTHSHACGDAAARNDTFLRGFELCNILGIKYTVVHSLWNRGNGISYENEDEFLTVNVNAIKPLLEHAEKNNVIILTENLLWGASIYPKVMSKLVSEVNSPWFGWCFDTGHANVHHVTPDALIGLEHAPLSLHIQDNHGTWQDEHLMPGDGNIDWENFMRVLHKIDYKGDFVLEAHHQTLEAPDEERDAMFRDLYERSQKLLTYYNTL